MEGDEAARVRRQGRVRGHPWRAARQVLRVRVRAPGERRWAVRVRIAFAPFPLLTLELELANGAVAAFSSDRANVQP